MKLTKALACLLLFALCLSLCSCGKKSESLTHEYTRSDAIAQYDFFSEEAVTPENYEEFSKAYMDFAANMLKDASADESVVLSPLSLYTALSMTANGASGKTLKELEKALGGDLSISEIDTFIHYLNERVKALNNDEGFVNSANSLWLRDDFSVKAQFLQTTVNYFDAEVFRTDLSADKINNWISDKTDGEITDMLSDLDKDTALVLVNTLLFDDEWVTPYSENDVYQGSFKGTNGEEPADFMVSNEMLIESKDAKGFVKSYKNTPCKFVAILPNENVSLDEYVNSLSGSKLDTLFQSLSGVKRCVAHIPQFELRKSLSLNDTAKKMGMLRWVNQLSNKWTRAADLDSIYSMFMIVLTWAVLFLLFKALNKGCDALALTALTSAGISVAFTLAYTRKLVAAYYLVSPVLLLGTLISLVCLALAVRK